MKNYILSKFASLLVVAALLTQVTQAMDNLPLLECPCREAMGKTNHLPSGKKVREELNNHAALLEDPNKPFYSGKMHCAFIQDSTLWFIWAANAHNPELPVIFDYGCYLTGESQDELKRFKGFEATYKIDGWLISLSAALPDVHPCPNLLKRATGQNSRDGTFSFCTPNFQPQDIVFHSNKLMSLEDIAVKSIALEVKKNLFNCQAHHMGILETVTDKEYLANFKEFYSENSYGLGRKIVELYFLLHVGLDLVPDAITDGIYKYIDIYSGH
jgi:hypothetical protein